MALAAMAAWSPSAEATTPRTFEAGKGTFLLDGKPYLLKSAELHYPRSSTRLLYAISKSGCLADFRDRFITGYFP